MNKRLVLAATLVCVSCASYKPAAAYQHAWTPVRVLFTVPREVMTRSPSGDSTRHADVSELRGSYIRMLADSLQVRITNVRLAAGAFDDPPAGSTAWVRLDSTTRFEARGADGSQSRTVGTVLVIAALAGIALALVALNGVLESLRKP